MPTAHTIDYAVYRVDLFPSVSATDPDEDGEVEVSICQRVTPSPLGHGFTLVTEFIVECLDDRVEGPAFQAYLQGVDAHLNISFQPYAARRTHAWIGAVYGGLDCAQGVIDALGPIQLRSEDGSDPCEYEHAVEGRIKVRTDATICREVALEAHEGMRLKTFGQRVGATHQWALDHVHALWV